MLCVTSKTAILILASFFFLSGSSLIINDQQARQFNTDIIEFGSCKFVINNVCPDPDVRFYLFTQTHPETPEGVRVGADAKVSNLSLTDFDPKKPTKVIIHGYNSNMWLNVLVEIRRQYLLTHDYNILMVDWGDLAAGPCYPAAVWNIRHVGKCASQLLQRLREAGAARLHVIGFSLGAHVTNYLALHLLPYRLPRITGLDPAGPGFLAAPASARLDASDARFVDVVHTNAFMQGVVAASGHVDFYLNGGVVQPGCWAETRFFACNHHRAPLYFAESINTAVGFFGWPCASWGDYFLGRCPPRTPQIVMGEHVDSGSGGVHLVITDSVAPYAVGEFTGPAIEILLRSELQRRQLLAMYKREIQEFIDEDDVVESLLQGNLTLDFIDEPSIDLIV